MKIRLLPFLAAVIAVAMLWPALGRAANLVVVEARGINMKPGDQVDGAKVLTLKDGQVLTLISSSGQIITLRGPLRRAPAPADTGASTVDVGAALRTLMTQELGTSTELGVVRGSANDPVPPTPWLVDVTHDGDRCVPVDQPIVFWRPGGGGAAVMTVAPDDRSWVARAEWQPGADRLLVPAAVPLRSRATYFIRLGDHESAITLILMPAALSNDAMRAAWMIEVGCATQVKALLQTAAVR